MCRIPSFPECRHQTLSVLSAVVAHRRTKAGTTEPGVVQSNLDRIKSSLLVRVDRFADAIAIGLVVMVMVDLASTLTLVLADGVDGDTHGSSDDDKEETGVHDVEKSG